MRRSHPGSPTWWAALAGLALPVACPGCGAPDLALCPSCRSRLVPATEGMPAPVSLAPVSLAPVSLACGPPGVPVLAARPYEGTLRRVVVAWKDRGRRDLTPVLAALLAEVVAARIEQLADDLPVSGWAGAGIALVPAPSSARATRQRGEDVVAVLARAAAGLVGEVHGGLGPTVAPVLRQRRGVADQAGLDRAARAGNVTGRLVLRGRPPPAAILVDDVVTTGATSSAAVACLRANGVAVLGVCSVSATPARRPLSERGGLR